MIKKTFVKVFALLLLVVLCFPNDAFAAKKKAKKAYSKSTPTAKVRYKSKNVSRSRRVLAPVNGILFQTLTGDTLLKQHSDDFFNPASVIKIATSLTALETWGYNYRFSTNIYTNGKIDEEGVLNGDLIMAGGGDPALFSENVFLISENLSRLGIKKVEGDLLITTPFYLNFEFSPQPSALQVKSIISGKRWTRPLEEAWSRYTQEYNKVGNIYSGIDIVGQARVINPENLPAEKHLLFTHQSRSLVDILKIQNDYSSNFMAEVIGRQLGGPQVIENFLIEKAGIKEEEIRVTSASGLGENKITPNAALQLLKSFHNSATLHGKRLDDLLPAAGVDEGTLDERFTEENLRGSVVAKTGTLLRQRVSALVGVAYTKDKGAVFFALLDRDEVTHARREQDKLVTEMIYQCGGPAPTRRVIEGFETQPKVVISK